jgi:hypothetical protein
MAKKTVQETTTTIDKDGKIEKVKIYRVEWVPSEHNFVKTYFSDDLRLRLKANEFDVLIFMLSRMGYDNKVTLPLGIKKQMCKEFGFYKWGTIGVGGVVLREDEQGDPEISMKSLNTTLWKLADKNVITKECQGVYIVNPFFFAKGKWAAVKTIYDNYNRIREEYEKKKANKTEAQKRMDENLEKGRNRIR